MVLFRSYSDLIMILFRSYADLIMILCTEVNQILPSLLLVHTHIHIAYRNTDTKTGCYTSLRMRALGLKKGDKWSFILSTPLEIDSLHCQDTVVLVCTEGRQCSD